MNLPTEFLTIESLSTLAGLSLAVYLLVEVFRVYLTRIEGVIPVKTVACLIGMALAVILTIISGPESVTPQVIILALANGSMAGLLATGGAAAVNAARDRKADAGVAAAGDVVARPTQRNRWGDRW